MREKGGLFWKPDSAVVSNVLRQVVDPTVGGCHTFPIRKGAPDTLNTAEGLLDWSRRYDLVKVPTVYSKTKWASRRLNSKELCDALDVPGWLSAVTSEHQRKSLTDLSIPGKLYQFLFQAIRKGVHWTSHLGAPGGGVKHKECCDTGSNATTEDVKRRRKRSDGVTTNTIDGAESEGAREEAEELTTVSLKAIKSDDAAVPVRLWNEAVLRGVKREHREACTKNSNLVRRFENLLNWLRKQSLKHWKKTVISEFWECFHGTEHSEDGRSDIEQWGLEMIKHVKKCSWWEWQGGSTIFFWRWPDPYQKDVRDGVPARFDQAPPEVFEQQPPYESTEQREKVQKKVRPVVEKGYIKLTKPDNVRSLLYMFDVPKGETDVRMVYDGSKNGLNDSTWAPWFPLPTVETMCRTLEPGFWCANNDYGENFLNFPLSVELQQYCGLDVSQVFPEAAAEVEDLLTAVWVRNAIGLKRSPYASVQGSLRAKAVIRSRVGLSKDQPNPFDWKSIRKNYPGSEDYDSSVVWIAKIDEEGLLAAELHQYVDDLRITAKDKELAWRASSRVAKICSYLGLQDVARKRREPSREPGAWAGCVVSTVNGQVCKSVTQERWEKTLSRIRWLAL